MNDKFSSAIMQQMAYKHTLLLQYATGFVKAAHALALRGLAVGSDDVPGEYQPPNDGKHKGIPGSAIAMLREAHIIENHDRRKSSRPSANGRWIATYRLTSLSAAERFLREQGIEVERQWRLELTA